MAYCDLLSIISNIGHQLTNIDIDNFSNDESDLHIFLNVYQIGKQCRNLESLSISMAFVDFLLPKFGIQTIFQKLSHLHLKSNKYKTPEVLSNIIINATEVEKLTVQFQVSRPFIQVEEEETLKDEDILEIVRQNEFKKLKSVSFNALEHPHSIGCKLPLSDLSLTALLTHCRNLESIGDLRKWNLEDIDTTMMILNSHWGWTKL